MRKYLLLITFYKISIMNNKNKCPSIYQDIFSNLLFIEQLLLIIDSFISIIGLVGIIFFSNIYLFTEKVLHSVSKVIQIKLNLVYHHN